MEKTTFEAGLVLVSGVTIGMGGGFRPADVSMNQEGNKETDEYSIYG